MLQQINEVFNPANAADFMRVLDHVGPGVYQHVIKDALEAEMQRSPLFAKAMIDAAARAARDRLANDEWLETQADYFDSDIHF